ncbi:DUF1552 domain-containing protein [Nannocystis radixulma]|uniref:DUF1552 domain-containing protein n=1 Tax=Nannocystis radixulma TaxID=2995305 RepID=A0ABT5BEA5_9BACT|nr:DUF1552 domain-containing protein [Nannocystis radixulma]MDC0672485.1 DUF1552 domain-containing protein [Nannocystis radixulma]
MSRPIPRRTVLRGMLAGVAVALPLPRLAGMLDGNGTAYADGTPLLPRYLTWFFGNGIDPALWVPAAVGQGAEWSLSPSLMPLADYKPWLSVLSGYEVKIPALYAHKSAPAAVLTGAQAAMNGDVTAPSIDQKIADLVNKDTAFPSGIHVGISNVTGAGALDFNISFSGPNAPNPPNYSPADLFATLLGLSGAQEPDPALFRRKNILDAVAEEAKALQGRLGAEDRMRLDRHLEGIGELQTQIDATIESADCGAPIDPDVAYPDRGEDGSISIARCQAFADLLAFAFSCELTRVASFVFSCAACHAPYTEAGLGTVTFHEDFGHRLSPMGIDYAMNGFHTGVAYAMTGLAELLKRFRDMPDGAGNLLDNAAIYTTSCVAQPWDHRMDDFPLLVIGKGGGLLRGDLHHRAAGDNASKVPFSLLKLFGSQEPSFGAAEGLVSDTIPELLV